MVLLYSLLKVKFPKQLDFFISLFLYPFYSWASEACEPSCLQLDEQSDYITKFKEIKKRDKRALWSLFSLSFCFDSLAKVLFCLNYFLAGNFSGVFFVIAFLRALRREEKRWQKILHCQDLNLC